MSLRSLALIVALSGCATADPTGTADFRFDPEDETSLADAEALALDHVASSDRLLQGVDSYATMRVGIDSLGMAHVRLQQDVAGIPVFGGQAIVHLDEQGGYVGITDDMVRELEVDTTPLYTADEALSLALDDYGQGHGLKHDATTDLFILRIDDIDHLTWRVVIPDFDRGEVSIPVYFVDAHDGTIVKTYNNAKNTALTDSDHTTYNMANGTRYSRVSVGDSSDANLATTHAAVGSTLAYFMSAFGRDSFDGRGAAVLSYSHYSRNYVNAFWDGSRLTFGDGDGVNSGYLGVLDVTAHEFGHGVTDYEADLTYSGESGALNEGASDILAAGVEAYVDGAVSADTWDIGEDCWLAAPALRYMSSPSSDGSSRDHYSARYSGSSDNGGVHWNSGIANHFFYLLSQGGQHHTAAYRAGTSVTGIGIDDAAQIWYLALTSYMTASTNFAGAATATASACSALGYPAATCQSVADAWSAVGVSTTSSGGGGTACNLTCTGGTLYTGILATGASAIVPGGTYYYSATGSTGTLCGPSGTDFDLSLYYSSSTRRFRSVATGTSSTSSELVSYASAGNYYYSVQAYTGSGDYQLCIQ